MTANRITIEVGDILNWEGDAIINPAHTSLLAGSGLSGAIHRTAGPELEQAAKLLAPCPVGEVRVTPAFRMRCRWVIHAVGPRWWDGTRSEAELQARMYANIAVAAEAYGMREVAVPAIGIGIHRFPVEVAAEICCVTLTTHSTSSQFRILLSSQELADIYRAKAQIACM
jgi:O-acetyl-ADP-ribose deacetylase (regulator of RNase III)